MNKQKMQQLRKMRAERDSLKERIKKNVFDPRKEVADTVKDYRTGQGKTVVIHGYGNEEWQKLQMKYKQKVGDLTREILLMEIFLDKVDDPEMRQILRYRYEDGMSQQEVGDKMGYSRQAIQKREERFWNEQDNGRTQYIAEREQRARADIERRTNERFYARAKGEDE